MKTGSVFRDSNSLYANPIVLIPRKRGDFRMFVGYRPLNTITIKERYPLPSIQDQLDRLAERKH